jgi:RNA-directed DNA polymerase
VRRFTSVREFAYSIQTEPGALRSLAKSVSSEYQLRSEKVKGKERLIDVPSPRLKSLLQRLNAAILAPFPLPACVMSRPGGSAHQHAATHAGQAWVVQLDIANFFPTVTRERVYLVWRDQIRCGDELANILADLTTHLGRLPVGAPTSPAMANLVMLEADKRILAGCQNGGVRYSRWVDDLALSGSHSPRMIGFVRHIIHASGFRLKRAKTLVSGPGQRHLITGLVANGSDPKAPREYLKNLKAYISAITHGDLADQPAAIRSAAGSLGYLKKTNPEFVAKQSERLRVSRR